MMAHFKLHFDPLSISSTKKKTKNNVRVGLPLTKFSGSEHDKSIKNITISVKQSGHARPDLGPNCLQRLSADNTSNTSHQVVKWPLTLKLSLLKDLGQS